MKAYATFDLYLAGQPRRHRAVLRALRAFVRASAPGLVEAVKWGNGCWLADGEPVAYVHADAGADHVQFGFVRGAELEDPRGLLRGEARFVRHVKVRRAADVDRVAFGALLAQAVRLGGVSRIRAARKRKGGSRGRS
jgi:hypothetical protein